ncbi:HIRAN domain-containing protein [Phenylobacterium sp.]|jgi:hypothetical protein|uniref:HIRAN domain-containing protein n=1 Tax=Phenylobacterium sp. TaxID=1871053 RepID=UPI002F3E5B9A
MVWILVAVAAAILIFVVVQNQRRPVAAVGGGLTVRFPGDGDYETDIVGESNYQTDLEAICGGRSKESHEFECEAMLRREPDNPYDPNAVCVWVQDRRVGYLARPLAAAFSQMAAARGVTAVVCDALIVGGWRDAKGESHFGVKLDLVEDDLDDEG